jgi:pyruvate/2-oxoglutarate dehydrogenase complex dihydrolipoamide acyltransferase (E2) component
VRIENGELKKADSSGASPDVQKPAFTQGRNDQAPNYALPASASGVIAACSAIADELITSRKLIGALDEENSALKARHQTDQRTIDLLTELNETRKSETEALRSAVAAKNDALSAKDVVIASQDKLIEALKHKKSSPWKRLGDALIGAAIFAILR